MICFQGELLSFIVSVYPVNILFHFGFQILSFSCLSFPLHSVLFLFHGCRSCVSGCSRSWGLEVISSPRPAQIAFASSQFPSSQPRPLSFVLLVFFFFFQISDDPGDLVMFESRIKNKNKKQIGSSVCQLVGFSVGSPGGHPVSSWEDPKSSV